MVLLGLGYGLSHVLSMYTHAHTTLLSKKSCLAIAQTTQGHVSLFKMTLLSKLLSGSSFEQCV